MEKGSLVDVVEVFETKDYEQANRYLRAGWVMISTHLWDYGHPVERHQGTVYCLAWRRGAGDVIHPSQESM